MKNKQQFLFWQNGRCVCSVESVKKISLREIF